MAIISPKNNNFFSILPPPPQQSKFLATQVELPNSIFGYE